MESKPDVVSEGSSDMLSLPGEKPDDGLRGKLLDMCVISDRDKMRVGRRAGTDAKTDKEAQRSIENLALRSEGRVEEERMAIKRALSTWRVKPTSSELNLNGKSINEGQWGALEDILELDSSSYAFQSLSMCNCFLGDAEVARICALMESNIVIKKVDLENNSVTDKGAVDVSEMLNFNRTIEEFDLRDNQLSTKGGEIIYEKVKGHRSLKLINGIPLEKLLSPPPPSPSISLINLHLSSAEGGLLNRILQDSPWAVVLQKLDISGNLFTYEDIKYLMAGIENLPLLRELVISRNDIDVQGAELLADLIRRDSRLTSMGVSGCGLTRGGKCMWGVEAIQKALKNNNTITKIDLSDNDVPRCLQLIINDSLKVNSSLRYDSITELLSLVQSCLPPLPSYPITSSDDKNITNEGFFDSFIDDKSYVFDPDFLSKENYVFRSFVIEPEKEVEVESNKKKRGMGQKIDRAHTEKGRIFGGAKTTVMGERKPTPGPLLGRRDLFVKQNKQNYYKLKQNLKKTHV